MVSLDEYGDEGPYGDHTGYYNSVEPFPVFQVTAITMRRKPIYLSTFTGRPPDEPSVLGEALNEVFIPLLHAAVPGDRRLLAAARGLLLPRRRGVDEEGLSRPRQAGDAGVWSYLRQFMYTKWVIVVDDDIDARDWKDVMWALSTAWTRRATSPSSRTRRSTISTSPRRSPAWAARSASTPPTRCRPETQREWGRKIRMSDDIVDLVTRKWPAYGLPGSGRPIWK